MNRPAAPPARRSLLPRRFFWRPAGVWPKPEDSLAAAGQKCRVLNPGDEPQPEGHVCYVAELARGKAVGDLTLVATADDMVLGNLQGLHTAADPAEHWTLKRRRFRRPRRLSGTAVVLSASSADNYCHWLIDSLPRLRLLEFAGFDLNSADWFLINQHSRGFHEQSLDELGIPAAKRLRCSKEFLWEADRLIVPSMPAPSAQVAGWAREYLRKHFLRQGEHKPRRKIYVSRKLAAGRRLLNEAEILPLLQKRGFEVVCLERTRFREQVEMFASARVVVGVHGAAMANLVFAPAGASVLELFSPVHQQICYQRIAGNMGLKHSCLVGEAAPHRARKTALANIRVDPAEFANHLEAADA